MNYRCILIVDALEPDVVAAFCQFPKLEETDKLYFGSGALSANFLQVLCDRSLNWRLGLLDAAGDKRIGSYDLGPVTWAEVSQIEFDGVYITVDTAAA